MNSGTNTLFLLEGSARQIVSMLIETAAEKKASDIHIEPLDEEIRVRYRLDGVLCAWGRADLELLPAIAARIKIMGHLDIANTRLPMDGRCRWQAGGRTLDLRISTMPTVRGEKIVLRLLDGSAVPGGLDELIPYEPSRLLLRRLIRQSQGLFLICGPTGSGKTTTLYALLQEIDSPEISIATLEDPVEVRVDGFCQSQVYEKGGLQFQNGLRALLRQDPDLLVIGEIRDRETAEIAVQAALTGHRVFSTLHTSRAVEAPLRLLDMGLEPYLIAEALLGMAAQRLVRRLCPACRQEQQDKQDHPFLRQGCAACLHTGYCGRLGVCEVVPAGPALRQAVRQKEGREAFTQAAIADQSVLLETCLASAIEAGWTDAEEIRRVYEV